MALVEDELVIGDGLIAGAVRRPGLARARMRGETDRFEQASDGHFDNHHRFFFSRMLSGIEALDADIAAVDTQIEALLSPVAHEADVVGNMVTTRSFGWSAPRLGRGS
jgi:hypothetical protein